MEKRTKEERYLKAVNKLVRSSLVSSFDTFNYQKLTDTLVDFSGAMAVALNLYNEENTKTKTVAISGSSKVISGASRLAGFNIKNKEWNIISSRIKKLEKDSFLKFSNLQEASSSAIPKKTAKLLEKTFNIGDVYLIKISHKKTLGDFIFFMKKGHALNKSLVKDYVGHVESILMRYREEKKTKESEGKLKEAHKMAKMGRCDYYHESNKFLWSDNIYEIFEIDRKKVKEPSYEAIFSMVHPEDREDVSKAHAKSLKSRKEHIFDYRLLLKDGRVKWVEQRCKTIFDKKGNPFHSIGVFQDITKTKKQEEELKEINFQQETFAKNLPGITYRCLCDKDWTMLYVNEYIKELTGYLASDFLENKVRSYGSIIYPEDRNYIEKEINKALRKGDFWNIEYRITDKYGKVKWVKEKGKKMEKGKEKDILSGIILDITKEKEIEDLLEEKEKLYEELAKQSRTFIWEVDKKGNYLYVSENVKDVIGYKAEELVNKKTVFDLHPEEGLEEFRKGVLKALKKKEKIQGFENPIVSKKGEVCWVMSAGFPVLDKKGNLLRYRGSDTDITKKKEIEIKLKKKEEQFELAIKGSNDGVWDWDLKTNNLYLSPKWKEQLGYKDNELKNEFKTFENLLHPDDKERVLKEVGKYIKGEIKEYSIEFRMLHKKNKVVWILAKGAAVYDEKGKPYRMAGSHSDITERKKYELELYESEMKFRQITENMGEVFWLRSADNNEMIYINPAYEKVWGRSCKSLYENPQSFIDSVLEEDKPIVFKEFEKYLKGGKFDLEYRIVRPNKEIRWVGVKTFPVKNEKGEIIRHTGVAVDITDRKIVERKVLEKNRELEKFQLAVENASDHIVITDEDGRCLYMNNAAERITGFKKEEILGEKVGTKDNWGGLMDKDVYEDLWRTIKEEKKPFMGDLKNKRKDGEEYEAKASIAPIKGSDGDVIFFTGIERDITKEKEVDKVKTEFVSLASHQLRTPLSTIGWYTEMLLSGDAGEVNQEQKDYLKEIYDGNQRMVELVNALLDVSRLELGTFIANPEKIDVKELADSIVKEIEPQIKEKKQTFEKSYEKNLPKMQSDPKLLGIIFQNFLSNAVKYTPEKGEINLEIKSLKKGEKVDNIKAGKDSILISVKDNGYGIPYSQQDRVFSKLFRADNVLQRDTEGTGLGLYIVKAVIEYSNGKTWFKSKENKGTTFYVMLPFDGMKKKKGTKSLNQ